MILTGWVTAGQQNPQFGTLSRYAVVRSVFVHVTQAFNSDGTDGLEVGYEGDPDGYGTSVDVASTGIKSVTLGAGAGYSGAARKVDATYTASGSTPTTGKALVVIDFDLVPIQPSS